MGAQILPENDGLAKPTHTMYLVLGMLSHVGPSSVGKQCPCPKAVCCGRELRNQGCGKKLSLPPAAEAHTMPALVEWEGDNIALILPKRMTQPALM